MVPGVTCSTFQDLGKARLSRRDFSPHQASNQPLSASVLTISVVLVIEKYLYEQLHCLQFEFGDVQGRPYNHL